MKILHVIGSLDPADGGPPRIAACLAAAHAQLGHDVTLISHAKPSAADAIDEMLGNVPYADKVHIEYLSPAHTFLERAMALRSRRKLVPFVEQADVVHLHNVWESILRVAGALARNTDKPYFVLLNGMLDPWSLHQKYWKKRFAMALAYRQMLDGAAGLHVGNHNEYELIEPLGLTAPRVVIPNGVFMEQIEPLPSAGQFYSGHPELQGRPFLLFLSRLHHKKGLDHLAESFGLFSQQNDEAHLVVAGPDGGAQRQFERRIRALGLDERVHLTGPLYEERKWQALRDAACFILPSRQEGFSVAITEALACSKPVIITEGCHFPEVAEVGAGEVVKLDDHALAKAMARVMGDARLREEMGRAGRQLVAERFTWRSAAEQAIAAYQPALEAHKKPRLPTKPLPATGEPAAVRAQARRPLHVCHVITSIDPAQGGPPTVARELAVAQARLGLRVSIAFHQQWGRGKIIDQTLRNTPGIDLVEIRRIMRLTFLEHVTAALAMHTIRRVLGDVDVFHLHGVWEPILLRTATKARRTGVPYVITPHGMLDPWALAQNRLKKRIAMALAYRRMLDGASVIHTLNDDERRLMAPLDLLPVRVVIANGVNLDELRPMPDAGQFQAAHPELGNRPFFLFMSRLHYKKGLDLLAEAYAQYCRGGGQMDLVVAGPDDGARRGLERDVERLNLAQRLHVVGPIYGDEKRHMLRDAFAFVLPSRQEGFSVAIAEAMACGLPVIISEDCHFPEVARVNAGRIVQLDIGQLTDAMLNLSINGDDAEQMGSAARQLVETRYTWPKIAEQMVGVYDQITD